MKYLVNKQTKEHTLLSGDGGRYSDLYFDVVEADADGWIPWSGEECPLPDECKCQIELQDGERPLPEPSRRWEWARNIGEFTIAAYRPILSETAEKEVTQAKVTAASILKSALGHMEDRAATYDKPGGERSMGKTVAMFNALTDHGLSEEQGWLFMVCLKMVRSQQGDYRSDSYEDGPAYFALAGETAAKERV